MAGTAHQARAVVGLSLVSSLALSLRVDFLAVWAGEGLQLGDSRIGSVYIAAAAVEVAASILAGRACDRFGCRRTATAAAAANAVVLAGFTVVPLVPAAGLVLIPASTGLDAVLWVALAVTVARVAPDDLERLYARQRTANAAGLGLGPLVGAAVLTQGWSALWLLGAATAGLVAALAHHGIPADADRAPGGAAPGATFLRCPRFVVLWTGSALSFAVLFAYEIVVPVVAVRDGMLALGMVGLLLAINPVLTIALQLPLAAAARDVPRRVAVVAGTSATGLAAALLLWRETAGVLVAVLVVFTVGEMLASPAQSAAIADAAPAGRSGAWIAAVGTSYSAGYAVAPAGGLALHRVGSEVLWVAVVAAGLVSAALFGACLTRRPAAAPGAAAPHPEWEPSERRDRNVASYALDDGERLLFGPPRGG